MTTGSPAPGSPGEGALERLTAVSRALTYAASLDEVLEITVDCAAGLLEAERVVLMLEGEDGLLHIRAARGVDADVVRRFGEPLDETLIKRLAAVFGEGAERRFLGVPLVVRGAVTGLLAVLLPEEYRHQAHHEWLLSALADQAAVALDNERNRAGRSSLEGRVEELRREGTVREEALRMVSHDLRSPLSALQGYLHLLEIEGYGPLTDGQRVAVARLQSIGSHLSALVGNLLDMSRLSAGHLTVECRPVLLRRLLQDAVNIVELKAREAGVTIQVDAPPDLLCLADEARLRQVVVELLQNAVKHSPDGGRVRVVGSAEVRDGKPTASVRVSDQGPGVPSEHAQEIFEPYHRLDTGGGGVGLGLAIGRELARLMGGLLELDGTAPEGATFLVRVPAAEGPSRSP